MFLKMKNPLKNLEEESTGMKKKSYIVGHHGNPGLRILLIQRSPLSNKSNVVLKSSSTSLRLGQVQPTSKPTCALQNQSQSNSHQSCFLKSCCMCLRNLRPDKDIYMYRGDQGFCSVECRNRQIIMDEKKELETSTKNMVASMRHRGRCKAHVFQEYYSGQQQGNSSIIKETNELF